MAEMLTKRKGLPDRRMAEMLTKRREKEEKSKIDRKDYQIFLGFYRNNDYIVTGKRFTRLCLRGFAKHESYIYLYKRN